MMREKRPYMLLTFSTTTQAISMEKCCQKAGIPGRLIPVPGTVRAGCGLAWRMTVEEYKQFDAEVDRLDICTEQRIRIEL